MLEEWLQNVLSAFSIFIHVCQLGKVTLKENYEILNS